MFPKLSLSSLRNPLLLSALAIGAGLSGLHRAAAAEPPYEPVMNAVSYDVAKAPATPRLSVEQLGEMLDTYYPGKNTVSNNGHTHYEINVERGTWKFHLNVNLSPNGRVLWLTAPLVSLDDPARSSPTALVELLKKNADLGPMFFQLNGRGMLQLTEPIANNDLTGENVQAFVEQFLKTISSTEPLWREQTLTAAGRTDSREDLAPVAQPPAPSRPRNPLAR